MDASPCDQTSPFYAGLPGPPLWTDAVPFDLVYGANCAAACSPSPLCSSSSSSSGSSSGGRTSGYLGYAGNGGGGCGMSANAGLVSPLLPSYAPQLQIHTISAGSGLASRAGALGDTPPRCSSMIEANVTLCFSRDPRMQLELRIVHEGEPFFMFTHKMVEEGYNALRQSQRLLIDFSMFPEKLAELFAACKASAASTKSANLSSGTLGATTHISAKLTLENPNSSSSVLLNIVETTSFRQIVHISMSLEQAPDSTIKTFLTRKSIILKNELEKRTAAFESQLRTLNSKLLEAEQAVANSGLSARHESERFATEIQRIQAETQERLDKQHKSTVGALQAAHHQSDEKARALENTLRAEVEATKLLAARLQTASDTANRELAKSSEEAIALRAEIDATRRELREVVRQRDSAEAATIATRDANEQSLREAELVRTELRSLSEQLRRAEEGRAAFEAECERERARGARMLEDLGRVQAQLEAATTDREVTSNDNAKANSIISKLQNEIQSMRGKLKVKGVVTVQQEKLLQEKCQLLDQAHQKISDLEDERDIQSVAIDKEKKSNEELKRQVEELQRTCTERLSMIEWLNSQLNYDAIKSEESNNNNVRYKEEFIDVATSPIRICPSPFPRSRPSEYQPVKSQFQPNSPCLKSQTAARMIYSMASADNQAEADVTNGLGHNKAKGILPSRRPQTGGEPPAPRKRSNFF